jgi:hypothetical protein
MGIPAMGHGVQGYRCSVGKPDLRVTHGEPYEYCPKGDGCNGVHAGVIPEY